jgi:hypothetical protein
VNSAVRSPVSMPDVFGAAPDVNRPVWSPLFIFGPAPYVNKLVASPTRLSDADGAAPDVNISTCSPPIMSVWLDAVCVSNLRNAVIFKFPRFVKLIVLKAITVKVVSE